MSDDRSIVCLSRSVAAFVTIQRPHRKTGAWSEVFRDQYNRQLGGWGYGMLFAPWTLQSLRSLAADSNAP
jgi:hypothetical protein